MKAISLTVNGLKHQYVVAPDLVLLDLLRRELKLTGAKQSCDRKGQCGACMVLVDGRAILSCLAKVADLDGAEVITVEGLGTPANPHLIQQAFVLAGAVQCGFCTPGMIMAAKSLLDHNQAPSRDEIKKALARNICRCTGYQKIFEAVELAGRFLRGETTPEAMAPRHEDGILGVSHPRPSAMAKACGAAHFTADHHIPGALELAVYRSPLPHARIVSIDASAALALPGVAGVVTAADIKGTNRLKMIQNDRPVLCEHKVHQIGSPILIVAAETAAQAQAALAAVQVELEPLPVLDCPATALADGAAQVHDDRPNLCYDQPQIKGAAGPALKEAAATIQARFHTQINHQAPLEPEATVAFWEEREGEPLLVIVGRSINIHQHMSMLQDALGFENMAYREAFAGGQFGIKIDVISEGIAGAAALHFRRPVRYIPSLTDSMLMASKRHAFDMNVQMAADDQGRISVYANDFVVDNGAYYSIGHVVVNRALLMLSGAYHIPHIQTRGRLVYTNNPFGSAARGAGAPQANFALECAVEMLAAKLGADSLEFRLRNSLRPGQSKSTGRVVEVWPIPELLEMIRPHYDRAQAEAAQANTQDGPLRRGVGLAAGSFGIGGPGDVGVASVELDPDGGVSVYAAAADPGEGNDSMLSQLTAHYLGLRLDQVRLHTRDTEDTAASGPAAGSRITYMIGGALMDALQQLRQAMTETGARDGAALAAAGRPTRYLGRKKNLEVGPLDPQTGQGPSFESEVHAVQLVELEVNTQTGQVRVLKMTTAVDAGTVINPQNLTGQLEGGMDMGVGFALREEYVAGQTRDWRTFQFPMVKHSFPMETLIHETPRPLGPLGATGVGEMCMVPTAPAVINGIFRATGAWVTSLPATPERVLAALAARG